MRKKGTPVTRSRVCESLTEANTSSRCSAEELCTTACSPCPCPCPSLSSSPTFRDTASSSSGRDTSFACSVCGEGKGRRDNRTHYSQHQATSVRNAGMAHTSIIHDITTISPHTLPYYSALRTALHCTALTSPHYMRLHFINPTCALSRTHPTLLLYSALTALH